MLVGEIGILKKKQKETKTPFHSVIYIVEQKHFQNTEMGMIWFGGVNGSLGKAQKR